MAPWRRGQSATHTLLTPAGRVGHVTGNGLSLAGSSWSCTPKSLTTVAQRKACRSAASGWAANLVATSA